MRWSGDLTNRVQLDQSRIEIQSLGGIEWTILGWTVVWGSKLWANSLMIGHHFSISDFYHARGPWTQVGALGIQEDKAKLEAQMTINSKYIFVVSMDVDPDKEALFNEVYDTEHIPNLLKVRGVHAATRVKGEAFDLSIGGSTRTIVHEGARYSAVYEIEGPHVLVSPEWAKAGEAGRWPSQVRPYTRNRKHVVYKVL
jgi:hypothetical protein